MRCIFCKQDSSASRSVEHVMPESIGSRKRVLKPGVVCDHCNNYFSRKVERPILTHPSMRNFRAWYQVPNKRGRFPSLVGHIAGTNVSVGLRIADLYDGLPPRRSRMADRRRSAAAKIETWRKAEIRRCAEELTRRDTVIRHVVDAVRAGVIAEAEAMLCLDEYRGYTEFEHRFQRLLNDDDVIEVWRKSGRGA